MRGAERGLVDSDLGGGVIKLRIARKGGGYRSRVVLLGPADVCSKYALTYICIVVHSASEIGRAHV